MLDKKKHHFLQLVIIFGSVTVISLLSAWGYRSGLENRTSMMGQSMGKMMYTRHASNITIAELLTREEKMEMAAGVEGHHNNQDLSLKNNYTLTTALVVILLPFIIAGSVFLGVVWLK